LLDQAFKVSRKSELISVGLEKATILNQISPFGQQLLMKQRGGWEQPEDEAWL